MMFFAQGACCGIDAAAARWANKPLSASHPNPADACCRKPRLELALAMRPLQLPFESGLIDTVVLRDTSAGDLECQ